MLRTLLLVVTGFVLVSGAANAEVRTYGILGDAGEWNADTRRILKSVKKAGIQELILPGDNLYDLDAGYEAAWNPWVSAGVRFPVVALGNHYLSYADEMQFFGMPAQYYSKVMGDARFIVLNSDNDLSAQEQAKFLSQELETSGERFTFIVFHHPPFTISERHQWTERASFQEKIRPILGKHSDKITALIVGHDHIASLVSVSGIPMIVSGAAFEQLPTKPRDYREGAFDILTLWLFKKDPHWVKMDVDPDLGQVWLNYVNAAQDKVGCSAKIFPRPVFIKDNCLKSTAK